MNSKYYVVTLCQHESNLCYVLQGANLDEAIQNEIDNGDAFGWDVNETPLTVPMLRKWFQEAFEMCFILESDTPIKFLKE